MKMRSAINGFLRISVPCGRCPERDGSSARNASSWTLLDEINVEILQIKGNGEVGDLVEVSVGEMTSGAS